MKLYFLIAVVFLHYLLSLGYILSKRQCIRLLAFIECKTSLYNGINAVIDFSSVDLSFVPLLIILKCATILVTKITVHIVKEQ